MNFERDTFNAGDLSFDRSIISTFHPLREAHSGTSAKAFGPIARLGPASSCIDLEITILSVEFSRKHFPHLEFAQFFFNVGQVLEVLESSSYRPIHALQEEAPLYLETLFNSYKEPSKA